MLINRKSRNLLECLLTHS